MAGYKQRLTVFFLFFILFSLPLLIGLTANGAVSADAGAEKKEGLVFEKEGEAPVIRFEDENLFAYFHREDKQLKVEGTGEIPLKELLKGGKLSLSFHLKAPYLEGSGKALELEPCKVSLKLAEDPFYWRLVTEDKSIGVGNFTVKATEKLKKLLPEEISSLTAGYQVLRAGKESAEILLLIKKERAEEPGIKIKGEVKTGKTVKTGSSGNNTSVSKPEEDSRVLISSLPPELSSMDFKKGKGELIGKLELMADYEFELPLVRKGESENKYTPVIQGKLTLIILKEVFND